MDEIVDVEDLRKLKLPELKSLCKQNGLPSSGTKEVLIKRISICMGMDEEDDAVDEDALLEGDPEEPELEESEKEDSAEPLASNEATTDGTPDDSSAESTPAPEKAPPPAENGDKENGLASPPKKQRIEAPPADPPKPMAQLTDAERIRMRAEKYGIQTSKPSLATKESRAARFGTGGDAPKAGAAKGPAKSTTAAAPKNMSAEDLEKLKQRSQRFGTTVSATLSSSDNVDKILKRKERFGDVTGSENKGKPADEDKRKERAERFGTANTVTTTTTTSNDTEAKKKRAERFKLNR